MLADSAARWVLVLHTALGVAAVASATHLVIWLRKYLRAQPGRRRSVMRFAWITLALQLAAFVCGNLMYPTYKVEVRSAYLENASAVASAETAHEREVAKVAAREGADAPAGTATSEMVRRAAHAARWFDVKEHWIALGVFASLALVLMLSLWQPARDGEAIAPIVTGLAWFVAGTVWLGAIIGVLTTAWRAV